MTSFMDREQAFEAKYAHDEELQFLVTARRDKLFVQWGLAQLHLAEGDAAAFNASVLSVPGGAGYDVRLTERMAGALRAHAAACGDGEVAAALRACGVAAKQQMLHGVSF